MMGRSGLSGASNTFFQVATWVKAAETDAIGEILVCAHFGDQFEIVYAATDSHIKLMRIHNPGKRNPTVLPPCRLREQVLVLAEEHTTERSGAVKKIGIIEFGCTIRLSGQDINTPVQQSDRNCPATWTSMYRDKLTG